MTSGYDFVDEFGIYDIEPEVVSELVEGRRAIV